VPTRLIVLGTSLGGLRALSVLLAALPADFGLPLAVVQHRSNGNGGLAEYLHGVSALGVCEVEDRQPIKPGQVYLAPADYHLLVGDGQFALSTDAPVNHARPAIDVLFESAASAYGAEVAGVVLTGASEDGAAGLAAIRRGGGAAIVQDPAEAECAVMPRAALAAVPDARALPLAAIGPALATLAGAAPVAGSAPGVRLA
jgi:two-component system chemotaxis response regulator CheB